MFEIEATVPESLAISKNVSGVTSPSPNLPDDTVENLAKVEPPSWISRSLVNLQPPDIVSSNALDAGPLVQSSLTYPIVPTLEKLKEPASKVKDAIERKDPPETAMSKPSATLP